MKQRFVKIAIIFLFCFSVSGVNAQDTDGIRPQLWSSFYVGWNVTEKIVVRNAFAYNVLLSSVQPWNEFSYGVSGAYKFHRLFEASAGFYAALSRQTNNLSSYEYRPHIGFRVASNTEKRWFITNLSRFEMRFFQYSDRENEIGFRFRNSTYAVVSLNRTTMLHDHNLFLFGSFEVFFNLGQEVRERFFNQFKYKLGFGYRLSYPWRFDIGIIYQDAKNTTAEPTNPTSNIITKYILEWGVAYIIPPKKRN